MQERALPPRRIIISLIAYFSCFALAGYVLDSWVFGMDSDHQEYWEMCGRIILAGAMFVAMVGGGMRLLQYFDNDEIQREKHRG